MVELIILWYAIGFISSLILSKLLTKSITVEDLVCCLLLGLLGFFILVVLCGVLIGIITSPIFKWYQKNKYKELF